MVAEMERTGTLQQMLLDAEEQTKDEMDTMRRQLIQQGLTPQQAQAVLALSREVIERVVWEVVPQLAEALIREEIARVMKED